MAWNAWLRQLVRAQKDTAGNVDFPPDLTGAWQIACRAAGVDDATLAARAAKHFGLAEADLSRCDSVALRFIPERVARTRLALPVQLEDQRLIVAVADPSDPNLESALRFSAGREVELRYASPEQLDNQITFAYARIAERLASRALGADAMGDGSDPVVALAAKLLRNAAAAGASDIHVQPFPGGGVVRFRIDGLLRRIQTLPRPVCDQMIRHFMAVAGMDSSHCAVPQDGRYEFFLDDRRIDLRLSTLPARGGQSLVIRLLDQSRAFALSNLGFAPNERNKLQRLIGCNAGILLLTGPTGCGKTTTLYSLLAGLNRVEASLVTIEDPVEYEMRGMAQVDIAPERGLTFATALRSILRQDPDVVLIGEIRDEESAQAAARAALTGHLVMSTLHTNDAASAIPRLLDLGLSQPILADALIGVVAQRLVRKLCDACATPVESPLRAGEARLKELTGDLPARRPHGCEECEYSGYRGRVPVVEILELAETDRQALLHNRFVVDEGKRAAGDNGLAHNTFEMIVSGVTTVEEAERAIGLSFWTGLAKAVDKPLPPGVISTSLFSNGHDNRLGVLLLAADAASMQPHRVALEAAGYAVEQVASLAQATDLLRRSSNVYLTVIDIAGENDTALHAVEIARNALAWAGLPLILLVPPADKAMHRALADELPDGFLDKPAAPETLVQRVKLLLHA